MNCSSTSNRSVSPTPAQNPTAFGPVEQRAPVPIATRQSDPEARTDRNRRLHIDPDPLAKPTVRVGPPRVAELVSGAVSLYQL